MPTQKKPTLLIVADLPNWAYHHMALFIRESLSEEFDVYIDFACVNVRDEFRKKNRPGITKQIKGALRNFYQRAQYCRTRKDGAYDIVLYLAYYLDIVANLKVTSNKIIKGIYTQGFPPKGMPDDYDSLNRIDFKTLSISQFVDTYLQDADAIVSGTPAVVEFYSQVFNPVYLAAMGLDEKAFIPRHSSIVDDTKFVIGWTGTPDRDFKGFHSHIVPAVERAKEQCPGIELKTRFSGSMKTLPLFYQGVDLIIIASEADGGPSLFAEACLSGVPAISTRIGRPYSVIQDGVNGFFVDRDVDSIVNKIIYLYNNRELLLSMKARIRSDYIDKFGQQIQINNWRQLFYETLRSSKDDDLKATSDGRSSYCLSNGSL